MMTDKEILTKAIFKAINNGYKKDNNKLYLIARGNMKSTLSIEFYRGLIFDHDFAKAFFEGISFFCNNIKVNKKYYCLECGRKHPNEWKYHLQQMVIEEEPLKYLEKFL